MAFLELKTLAAFNTAIELLMDLLMASVKYSSPGLMQFMPSHPILAGLGISFTNGSTDCLKIWIVACSNTGKDGSHCFIAM